MPRLGENLILGHIVGQLNSFANNFDAQTQKLSTFVFILCHLLHI
jgi:hypothetical protein